MRLRSVGANDEGALGDDGGTPRRTCTSSAVVWLLVTLVPLLAGDLAAGDAPGTIRYQAEVTGGAGTTGRRAEVTGGIGRNGSGAGAWSRPGSPARLAAASARDAARDRTGDEADVRVALFNVLELSTEKLTDVDEGGVGRDEQVRAAAAIVQRLRPDVLVVNEIDHDYAAVEEGHDLGLNARRLVDAYLDRGPEAIRYAHVYAAPNNTGILSGLDLDDDGHVATAADRGTRRHGNDAFGYGTYPGQFSMAVLSSLPLRVDEARTFRTFRWIDMPDNHIPPGVYTEAELERFRLSSKSHWDLPVEVGATTLHLLVSHPTPPVFDGDEDRNGRRNFDEIGFWAAYLDDAAWIYDDDGKGGGYGSDDPFLIAGDLNAPPRDTEVVYDGVPAIGQLLRHPRVQDPGRHLTSRGALQGREPGPPRHVERHTADWGEGHRVDYLLPGRDVRVLDGGVFWPAESEDPRGHRLAEKASDHRLVWLDLELDP